MYSFLSWFFIVVLVVAVMGAGLYGYAKHRSVYYEGPVSDHFDGERFFYPYFERKREKYDFWKWQFDRQRAEWPEWVEIKQKDTPPVRVEGDDIRVSYVNHMTALIQTRGVNILTDPIWSERASPLSFIGPKRVKAAGVDFDKLPPIDYVTISHSHYDHMDIPTIKRLWKAFDPVFIMPLGNDTIIKRHVPEIRTVVLDWHESTPIAGGMNIHAWPAQHWTKRTMVDTNKSLWANFILERPEGLKPVFIAGDIGYGEGYDSISAHDRFDDFEFAFIPYGSFEPRWFMSYSHMNPKESVQTFRNLGARYAIGTHHGTFQLTDEPYNQPFDDLRQELILQGISEQNFRVLDNGESWLIPAAE